MDKIQENHHEQADSTSTRRHGAELKAAILDAAWEQLIADGRPGEQHARQLLQPGQPHQPSSARRS